MAQITIVYYSETGNTEAMASMVAKGVEAAGATAKIVSVDGFDVAVVGRIIRIGQQVEHAAFFIV